MRIHASTLMALLLLSPTVLRLRRDAATVTLARPGVIVGTVTVAGTNQPLPDSRVSVESANRATTADARGGFVLAQVPSGAVVVRVTHDRFAPADMPVMVIADDTARVQIALSPITQLPATNSTACAKNEYRNISGPIIVEPPPHPIRRRGSVKRIVRVTPAIGGKTLWDLDADGELNIARPGVWMVTPQASFEITAAMWGGGGGNSGGRPAVGAGGGGGYSTGVFTVRADSTYTIIVGGGGAPPLMLNCGGDGGFGGGGAGGGAAEHDDDERLGAGDPGVPFAEGGLGHSVPAGATAGGGGGGLSGVFAGAIPAQDNALVIAGGAGGGAVQSGDGGAGGGSDGEPGASYAPGGPGTQTAGGSAGRGGAPIKRTADGALCLAHPDGTDRPGGSTAGAAGAGGGGGSASLCPAGGGGGGGYFGGGGGGRHQGGGGGGSGFVAASVRGTTNAGHGSAPGNVEDPRNGGSGVGATKEQALGAPGRVIIF
jgi:hypothetical protein